MQVVVLSIHLVVCVCLIGLVLLQRSEGGALGMGGGGSSALMSGRGAADALARMTQVAGFFFLITSLSLTVLSGAASSEGRSVFDLIPHSERSAPVTLPAAPAPAPATPLQPAHQDPTQSSAPQAAQSQLASAVVPGPAAPLQARPTPVATRATPAMTPPAQSANANRAITIPASTTTVAPQGAAHAPAQRSTVATTQATTGATSPHLILPLSPGAQALANGQTAPESSDTTGPQAVRHQRAGPDQ